MSNTLGSINSVLNMSESHYSEIWAKLFATLLLGFWGKSLFIVLLILALFFGVRRRNPKAAIVFIAMAIVVGFGAWFVRVANIM